MKNKAKRIRKISSRLLEISLIFIFAFVLAPKLTAATTYKVFVVDHPVSDEPILPTTIISGPESREISLKAAKGQYQSASFAIQTEGDSVSNFLATPGDLSSGGNTIPASAVDIRAVKCWYQSNALHADWNASNSKEAGVRNLVPELLLKDDDLIRVDLNGYNLTGQTIAINKDAKTLARSSDNWLTDGVKTDDIATLEGSTTAANDGEYVISDVTPLVLTYSTGAATTSESGNGLQTFTNKHNYLRTHDSQVLISGRNQETIGQADWPIDTSTLQPFNLPSGVTKQFWITMHVPADVAPGTYHGNITLTADGIANQTIDLTVQVYSFALEQPNLIYGLFYAGATKSDFPEGTLAQAWKSPTQYQAEMADMVRHGILHPTFNSFPYDPTVGYEGDLDMRAAAGMPRDFLIFGGISPDNPPPATEGELNDFESQAQTQKDRIDAYDNGNGWGTLYIEGIDEAGHDLLGDEIPAFERIHNTGSKVFITTNDGQAPFEAAGDHVDIATYAWAPSAAEAAKWHSVGAKILSYANPQTSNENPYVFRRNYGWLLFKNNYDGEFDYQYQAKFTGHMWNDFATPAGDYRNHNLTYPTANGVVDTVAFEGLSEAVNDMRYLATLQKAIAEHPGPNAVAAQTWIDSVNPDDNLDAVRLTMADWINLLSSNNADINLDSYVNSLDLDILKSDFLKLAADLANPRSDINGDGQVNVKDAGIMMSQWAP